MNPNTSQPFFRSYSGSSFSNVSQRQSDEEVMDSRGGEQYSTDGTLLRSVSQLPAKYRQVFADRFPVFNVIQSKVFDDVMKTNKSIAISAPTGSGKTVVFEMAVIKELMDLEANGCTMSGLKAVYMAPLKKLVDEKYSELKRSFERFGINCVQMTGDSEMKDYERLRDVNIVVTTPEKWDYMLRNNEQNALIRGIQLMLIDEIHTINDESRGATIEAVLSRMKTLRLVQLQNGSGPPLRFIAASATAPNVDDISQWLDPMNAVGYNLSETLRPVRLQKIVMGYSCQKSWNDFRFDIQLNYKLDSLIRSYSESKPTLIFCSTRKGVLMTAQTLTKTSLNLFNSNEQRINVTKRLNPLKAADLKGYIAKGVGYHHSGLDKSDRAIVEALFLEGLIPVLISTTTLAMGVNLPAHLVIIKSTSQYTQNGCHEYPETQILQMIGRAGRPQFDTNAFAIIMTKDETKAKYERLLNGTQIIESNLHKNLVEHLNAEIALRTVTSIDIAVNWIRSTFLYIRVMQNPQYYGSTVQMSNIEQCLQMVQSWCHTELVGLKEADMISTDPEFSQISSTPMGRLMARHSISLQTMKKFCEITTKEVSLKELIEEMTQCYEIRQEIQLRVNEKTILNELNKSAAQSIRFPINGKIKSAEMKINCLIQASFGLLSIQDSTLIQDSLKLMRTGQRLSKCICEVIYFKVKENPNAINSKSLLNAILLNKCFKAKIWYDSNQVAIQLNRIGQKYSKALVERGLVSFNLIKNADPRDVEFCLKRNPPFGRQLIDEVKHLPYYSLTIEQNMNKGLNSNEAVLKLVAKLENIENLKERIILFQNHCCFLIVCNEDNQLFYCNKLFDSYLIKNNGVFETKGITISRNEKSEYISAHLISDSFVGLDVECRLKPMFGSCGAGDAVNAGVIRTTADPIRANRSTAFSDTSWESTDSSESESCCQHKCLNKTTCGHICCKKGLKSENTQKQVTKNKRQQQLGEKSTESTAKKAKQSKPNSNLDEWLKTFSKKNCDQKSQTNEINDKTNAKTQSVYFKDEKYADIESDGEDLNSIFNDGFDDLDFDFDVNTQLQPKEELVDKDFEFEKQLEDIFSCNEDFQEFETEINDLTEEEFNREPIDWNELRETGEPMGENDWREPMISNEERDRDEPTVGLEKREVLESFMMSQWSLFLPTTDLKGKTFLTIP
ncbi:unnamed protein product [Medioppia subpectinata]|uniref:DNA 3'-5' helicase n=1 Tax=Medioppia subpectinata TaxID=1979941 RepID=A0A7R9PTY8_9ACAR|nr:unnamed protein product [Medioppia subpectinata]CAG2100960.1 unnamed protein product [Medioppia subpectinata]